MHLARHGARCVDPDVLPVDHDRFAGRIAEPHGELVRRPPGPACRLLSALSIIGLSITCTKSACRLDERPVDTARPADDRLGVLRAEGGDRHGGQREQQQDQADHARTPAGSATRRPMASAMSRTSFISRSNCSG